MHFYTLTAGGMNGGQLYTNENYSPQRRGPPAGPGSGIVLYREINIGALLARHCHATSLLKVRAIDQYDDLLLPEVRLLAQLPVFASGEHFDDAPYWHRHGTQRSGA